MPWLAWLTIAAGFYPLARAFRANLRTTLRDSLFWAALAWVSWGFFLTDPANVDLGYLALCLTGGAGVAVLGARRPHVFAWNFVVLGLLCVMLLPLLEGMVIQVLSFNLERKIFLAAVLAVVIGNYLGTRLALAALAVAVACLGTYLQILDAATWPPIVILVAIGGAPWFALVGRKQVESLEGDWFSFRDRYGIVWGSRLRDQFNAAAKNNDLPIRLHWRGMELQNEAAGQRVEEARAFLKSLTKRFLESEEGGFENSRGPNAI